MRKTLIIAFLMLATQSALAATITANITATVLGPANISFPMEREANTTQVSDQLAINSTRDLHFELSHQESDVCRLSNADRTGMVLASCETVTINFN